MYTHPYIRHTLIHMCTHTGTNTYTHTYRIYAHTVNMTEVPSFTSRRQTVELGSAGSGRVCLAEERETAEQRPSREAAWVNTGVAYVSCHCGRPHGNLQD